ncbi:MAG: hypothetical protein HKO64_11185 [Xanthomonadales bacterium]|nr:hypothetical protein [Gammaproteobacteria bacterium]NNE05652.1 hypothetical protein [Xanthomonadales bacterium]NNL96175.1 hypothetical protein [Xanthomonadales bacterium]
MRNMFWVTAILGLSLGFPAAHAVEIESSTTQYLSFRECVAGETPCDRFKATNTSKIDGLPGSRDSQASHDEEGFGSASGRTELSRQAFGSEHHAQAASVAGTRVGSNGFMIQKYSNNTEQSQTLTFRGTLVFKQTIPESDAEIPEGSLGGSGANAELGAFRYSKEKIEAGATAEDNFRLLLSGPKDEANLTDLGFKGSDQSHNQSGDGTQVVSVSVTTSPGESTWFWAGLQSLAANGAEVTAHFTTELVVTGVD